MELLWWLITAVVVIGVLFPIYQCVLYYPFVVSNIIFIVVFINFTRYVFLLKHTFWAHHQLTKIIVGVLCFPLIFYLISEINYFKTYMDEVGLYAIFKPAVDNLTTAPDVTRYIRNEMLFFGIGAVIIACIMPFRLIMSVWRTHNKGTV